MVNATIARCAVVLLLAAAVLGAAAWMRSAEYDEQYTLFLTAGVARPAWPDVPFAAGDVQVVQRGRATLAGIARDLRATDVHPPLYFWAVALWRQMFGPSLIAARLLSVICGLGGLVLTGLIAARAGIPPSLAMLLTFGCYGFAYSSVIARGFALAQLLNLAGVLCLVRSIGRGTGALRYGQRSHGHPHPRKPSEAATHFMAGLLFGAAAASNYLASFVGLSVSLAVLWRADRFGHHQAPRCHGRSCGGHLCVTGDGADDRDKPGHDYLSRGRIPFSRSRRLSAAWAEHRLLVELGIVPGLVAWLPLTAWFFIAQRTSRAGQFPAFHLITASKRLLMYAAANLFGGIPLYLPSPFRAAGAAGIATLLCLLVVSIAARWHHIGTSATRCTLAAGAIAPAAGLLLLGLAFNTTPIELRYLSFAVPFAMVLLAGALQSLPRMPRHVLLGAVLALQSLALAGLLTRPETMQPARATAAAAARLGGNPLVVLPRGNDGVGIVGAFALEAPPELRIRLVDPTDTPAQLLQHVGTEGHVVLALMEQDAASRTAAATMRTAFGSPCWRRIAEAFNLLAVERRCGED